MNETELLFTEILNCNRMSLYINKGLRLGKRESALVSAVLKRRVAGQPLQYILGKTEFMGLEFKVTPEVLIPRPETEVLVEIVLRLASSALCKKIRLPAGNSGLDILDLGTGSGCIAVSLAKFISQARITATDNSQKALEVARFNASMNAVSDKVRFIHSDLFSNHKLRSIGYDVIVSNPPYIPTTEIEDLPVEVRCEPHIALNGGKDGLNFYRSIVNQAYDYLKAGGFLVMEMGYNQYEDINKIIKLSGKFKLIDTVKDYNNIKRVIVAQLIGDIPKF
jgi:release factor glutamine methyltransferase